MLFATFISAQTEGADSLDYDDEQIAKPEPEGDYRVGVKMGIQICTLLGEELKNPDMALGLVGGMYLKRNISPRFSLQAEVSGSLRGSSFSNDAGEYGKIRLFYVDFPLMGATKIGSVEKSNILLYGIQYSRLVSSNLFRENQSLPETGRVPLKRNDFSLIAGYQTQGDFIGAQFLLKYGISNMNAGGPWPQDAKPVNTGKSITNFNLEINFIF